MLFHEWRINGLEKWSRTVGSIECSAQKIRARGVNVSLCFSVNFSLHTFSCGVLVTELEKN